MESLAWKLLAAGSAAIAGAVAAKIVQTVWETAGRSVPADPQNPETTGWGEAIAYAALTGLAVGMARVAAQRKAASYYAASTGHLPEGMESPAEA